MSERKPPRYDLNGGEISCAAASELIGIMPSRNRLANRHSSVPAAPEPSSYVAATWQDQEEVTDPLTGLVDRTVTDPGAPFSPEVVIRLRELRRNEPATYETLRARLKQHGCRVTKLDQAISEEIGTNGRGPTHSDILVCLAEVADLFHTAHETAFADLDINGHRETWSIRSKGFKRWLVRQFFQETGGAPSGEAVESALNVIEAKALYDAPEREVSIRIGGVDDKLYLDLGDETWRAVEIRQTGWRVVENPAVRFRRSTGVQPLPVPIPGGSIESLRPFLNIRSDADFVLVVTWALAVLRNRGPYPVMVLSGEQGSAKSTFSTILRSLLDPNTAALRALPREERDLYCAANNAHVLAYDNVSGLPAWTSDTFCRLSTGAAYAARRLYTDQDEVLFEAARPVILNGIEDIVNRPDLADRAIFLVLEPIPEDRRRPEAELWADFETVRPKILGVLLDALVRGLRDLPDTRLDRLPRMADFALWASACETAIWPAGTFSSAFCGNREEAVENVIDADPVAAALRAFMAERTEWSGTYSDLLDVLAEEAGERAIKSKLWPTSTRALSGRLRRAATFLRNVGLNLEYGRRGRARDRIVRISRETDSARMIPSASSAEAASLAYNNGSGPMQERTGSPPTDASRSDVASSTVRTNRHTPPVADDADDRDAKSQEQSRDWSTRV